MTRLWMVRHGRAAAGWDVDPDPPLDDVGRSQALEVARLLAPLGVRQVFTSPLLRCRQTAFPLATAWKTEALVEPRVAEIPSPEGYAMEERVGWLREKMAGTWTECAESSGAVYANYRDTVVATARELREDSVVFSHFVAINAVIGAAVGDDRMVVASLDNCSVTEFEVEPDGTLVLREMGREADTLIR